MVNFWIFREYSFGSPFRNVNSGRNTEGDQENNRRLQIATEKYLEEFQSKACFSVLTNRAAQPRGVYLGNSERCMGLPSDHRSIDLQPDETLHQTKQQLHS